jgi:hypothetical protein
LTSRVKRDAAVLVMQRLCSDWQCEVVALELQRTFWEKATILHAEYHRPPDAPHVYDRATEF